MKHMYNCFMKGSDIIIKICALCVMIVNNRKATTKNGNRSHYKHKST